MATYLYINELKAVSKYSGPAVFFIYDSVSGWVQDEWAISAIFYTTNRTKEITEKEAKQIIKDSYSFKLSGFLEAQGITKEDVTLEGLVEQIVKKSHSVISKGMAREIIISFAANPKQWAFIFKAPSDDCKLWICLNVIQYASEDEKVKAAADKLMEETKLTPEAVAYIEAYSKSGNSETEQVESSKGSVDSGKADEKTTVISDEENTYKNFIRHLGMTNAQLPHHVDKILKYTEALGLKMNYADGGNGNLITPVYNITFTKPKKGEYKGKVRFDHKLSKLAVKNRLSEKKITELFKEFETKITENTSFREAVLYSDEYIYVFGDIFCSDFLVKEYLELIRTIAKVHFPPKAKLLEVEKFLYGKDNGENVEKVKIIDPAFAGNEKLDQLIHKFCEEKDKSSFGMVMNYLLELAKKDGRIYSPLAIKNADTLDFAPLTIKGADGSHWLPLYTHSDDINVKDIPVAIGKLTIGDSLKSALGFDEEVGVVINPSREPFAVDRETVKRFLAVLQSSAPAGIKYLMFKEYGYFGPTDGVEINNNSYRLVNSVDSENESTYSECELITSDWLDRILQIICKWEDDYCNNGIMDGTQWSLIYKLSDGTERNIFGSNLFPKDISDFVELIEQLPGVCINDTVTEYTRKERCYRSLMENAQPDCEACYNALKENEDYKEDYKDYMNTHPIDVAKELEAIPEADYNECSALLSMLVCYDRFDNEAFSYWFEKGKVTELLNRMCLLLDEDIKWKTEGNDLYSE